FSTRETSGVIRGFDVNSGKLLWAFDPGAKDPNAIPADEHAFTDGIHHGCRKRWHNAGRLRAKIPRSVFIVAHHQRRGKAVYPC
ncbi:hypothetical protein MJO10_33160, partial [Salmonella enterica subsp. enterica serovar Anatum]|nr:hypothetical protein [Salmonella enterica subsp. enterica serovar Anatum]